MSQQVRLFALEAPEKLSAAQHEFEAKSVEAAMAPYIGPCKVLIFDGGWKLRELTRPEVELEELADPEE